MMNHGVNVGMNLGGITYYSSEVKWVDIAKQSEEWITSRTNGHQWNSGETNKVQWRSDGYPSSLERKSLCETFMTLTSNIPTVFNSTLFCRN